MAETEEGAPGDRGLGHLTCLLRNLYASQEATVRLDMEQRTGSKLGKEYVKGVYCHPAYSSILAWRIPVDRGAWWAIVHKVAKSGT